MFFTIKNLTRAKTQVINLDNIIHIYYRIETNPAENIAYTNIYLKFVNNDVMLIDFLTRKSNDINLLEAEALKKLEYYQNQFNNALNNK